MALPKYLFVTRKTEPDGSTWFQAAVGERSPLLEDDGTTAIIGTYKLLKSNRWKLQPTLVQVPARKKS